MRNSILLPLLASYLFSSALAWVPPYAAVSLGMSPCLRGLHKSFSPSGVFLPWHVLPQPPSPQSKGTTIPPLAWSAFFQEHAFSHVPDNVSFHISVLLMCPLHFCSSQQLMPFL